MRRLRMVCAVAVVAGALIVPAGAGPACASGPHAALVVDTGSRVLRYCVALPSSSVSGAKLIELAGSQYGLDYHFGSGGAAVCRLAGVGPDGDDCFADYPNYWGYWRGTRSGGWSWSSVGAASTTVSDGDVDGWAWGKGDDGSTHPQPPPSTFASVCASAAHTSPAPARSTPIARTASAPPPPAPSPISSPTPSKEAHRSRRHGRDRPRRHSRHHPHRHHDSGVTVRASSGAAPSTTSGPPVAGIAGVAAVCLIALTGGAIARRRRVNRT